MEKQLEAYIQGLQDFEIFVGMVAQMRKAQDAANRAMAESNDYSEALIYINKAEEWEKRVDNFLEKQGL